MAHLVSVKRQLATQELSIIAVTSIIQKWMQQISPVERPELPLIIFYQMRLRSVFLLVEFHNLIV